MKILLVILLLNLTGCATMFNVMADYYDSEDKCLQAVKNNTRQPDYCGAGSTKTTGKAYDARGRYIGEIRTNDQTRTTR